jgi:hypothetical protein
LILIVRCFVVFFVKTWWQIVILRGLGVVVVVVVVAVVVVVVVAGAVVVDGVVVVVPVVVVAPVVVVPVVVVAPVVVLPVVVVVLSVCCGLSGPLPAIALAVTVPPARSTAKATAVKTLCFIGPLIEDFSVSPVSLTLKRRS